MSRPPEPPSPTGRSDTVASGSEPWAFVGADNASLSHLVVTGKRWVVRRFNDTTHLDRH